VSEETGSLRSVEVMLRQGVKSAYYIASVTVSEERRQLDRQMPQTARVATDSAKYTFVMGRTRQVNLDVTDVFPVA
jgi:hypothetical protein